MKLNAVCSLVASCVCQCFFWYAMFHVDRHSRFSKSLSWTSKDSDSSLHKDLLGAGCFLLSWIGSIVTGTAHRLQGINSGLGIARCTRRFLMSYVSAKRQSQVSQGHRVSCAFCGEEMFLTDSWRKDTRKARHGQGCKTRTSLELYWLVKRVFVWSGGSIKEGKVTRD